MMQTILGFVRWLRSQEIAVLVGLALVVGSVWAFVEIADEVVERETQTLDERVLRALRREDDPKTPIGPSWLHEAGRDVTALGGVVVLTLVTAIAATFLGLRKQKHAMVFLICVVVGGQLISTLLKASFDRPRPGVVPHLSIVSTSSFPSGHSMLSAVVYLTLGATLARFVEGWRLRIFMIVTAAALTFLVGLSRMYMGVHYPTDVLAGWLAGLTWATICWLVARWLQQRRTLERPEEGVDVPGSNGAPAEGATDAAADAGADAATGEAR